MASRAKLSVVLLARNEERRIPACLESVAWADEIIVVDGESTDRTKEICLAQGAKVIEHPFAGSFAEARNCGTQAAAGDWILQLDADERVTPELRQKIALVLKDAQGHAAFKFRRKNFFLGREMRHGGWDHWSLHLFQKGRARYDGRVHERLLVDGPVGQLDAYVEHYPFSSIAEFIERQNRYTDLQAQELHEAIPRLSRTQLVGRLVFRPWKIFWKYYVRKQGHLDGRHGFVFSVLYAWVQFLVWAKYYEFWRRDVSIRHRRPVP